MYDRRPQLEIVGSVNGDLAQNVAQKAIAGIRPSLPEIVAVVVGVSPSMFDTLVKDGRMPSANAPPGSRCPSLATVDQPADLS